MHTMQAAGGEGRTSCAGEHMRHTCGSRRRMNINTRHNETLCYAMMVAWTSGEVRDM